MMEKIISVKKDNGYYVISYVSGDKARLSLLNDHVFRFHLDPNGLFKEFPTPHDENHKATIIAKTRLDYGTEVFEKSEMIVDNGKIFIKTMKIVICFDKSSGLMRVENKSDCKIVFEEAKSLILTANKAIQTLHQDSDEYFFGCGTQNGRFSHKGKTVLIENLNHWEDGGVASPNPFYWSTEGYGTVRNTWTPGVYDFGNLQNKFIEISHETDDFDAYYFVNAQPVGILQDYYELTGKPILMPEYAFYQSHFNAYNRDYWVEVSQSNDLENKGVKFEDGKFYKEYHPDRIGNKRGVLESLNGENGNYQFSARAVIDRYKMHDMPLGWFIPNDGYGAGYGQTESLDGDIENLKRFVEYCNENGVQVGLWTESNLHPEDVSSPKKGERDIKREVERAGIVALKTDVAWVGSGYSFGLNGIEDAATIFVNSTKGSIRPMIITVDGWAGTQRHSSVWTGDQPGGEWENIRFHIPTIIGTSLSGQPNVGSDIDGIFKGLDREINIREFQWKSFTPIQMNMDGWGYNPKTPFYFDKEVTDINRAYLKIKSTLMPYIYSIAFEALKGLPMVRSIALEFPLESPSYTVDSQYQYMWGPNILIAPIYNAEKDSGGNSIRDGLFLPGSEQIWIDFLTGEKYKGGHIINNLSVPLWKLPVFIKDGSIIPITRPNNNPNEVRRNERIFIIYPNEESYFNLYEDDGISTDYLNGKYALTHVKCFGPRSNEKGTLKIILNKSEGTFKSFVKNKYTLINIMTSEIPTSITVSLNGKKIPMKKVENKTDFTNLENVYYFDEQFIISKYLSGTSRQKLYQKFLSIKIEKLDASNTIVEVFINDYINKDKIFYNNSDIDRNTETPSDIKVEENLEIPFSLRISWLKVTDAESYDVERNGTLFRNIKNEFITFENLSHINSHKFRVRSVRDSGVSLWSPELIGIVKDPFKNLIRYVRSFCNIPEQKNQELKNLTTNDNNIWHTRWDEQYGTADPENNKHLILKFDLGDVNKLNRIEYHPRTDVGNGTIFQLQYRTSLDNETWTDYSQIIEWECDPSTKNIFTSEEIRFVEMKILESLGNFGSGKKMLFFKEN